MKTKIFVLVGLALLVVAASAGAVRKIEEFELRAGDLVIKGYGGFRPETLPKTGTRRSKSSAAAKSRPSPASFRRSSTSSTSSSTVTARSTPRASESAPRQISWPPTSPPPAVPAATRSSAPASAGRRLPRTGAYPGRLAGLTLFNGPKKNGNDTVLVHFLRQGPGTDHLHHPDRDQKINKGVYGYRTKRKSRRSPAATASRYPAP